MMVKGVKGGQGWSKVPRMVKDGQRCQGWSRMVKDGQGWSGVKVSIKVVSFVFYENYGKTISRPVFQWMF